MDEPLNTNDDDTKTETTLHRSTTKKVFGGVAGGISERFDVDANIVRVVFVVLALAYGLGAAVYLAMWALIPRSTSEAAAAAPEEELDPSRVRWLRYALPLGVIVLAVVLITTFRSTPVGGVGLSVAWLIFLVVLAIIALRAPARRLTLRRFLALGFLSVLSFLILVTGSFLIAVQVIGVPLKGGSGVKEWRPSTIAEMQRVYHGAFGVSTIDLRNVHFTSGTWSIVATQGVGELIVYVPSNVTVDLRTHVGIGNVQDESFRTYVPTSSSAVKGARTVYLNLNLQVGIGQIQISRTVVARADPIPPSKPTSPTPPTPPSN
jgi:phage shock protein PspC (stress-responsive transcriptional regulator)/predicted membrane protein